MQAADKRVKEEQKKRDEEEKKKKEAAQKDISMADATQPSPTDSAQMEAPKDNTKMEVD